MFLDVNIDANKLVDQLNKLATPAVQQTLATYVKQWTMQGHVNMTIGELWFVAAAFLVVCAVGCFLIEAVEDAEGIAAFFGIFLIVGAVIAVLVGVHVYTDGYLQVNNPQYYAINELINTLRG